MHGTDGVRTEFDTEKLLSTFARDPQTRSGSMTYSKIDDNKRLKSFDIERLPFLKRGLTKTNFAWSMSTRSARSRSRTIRSSFHGSGGSR